MSIILSPSYTWVDGEVVTAVKLNLAAVPTAASNQTYTFSVGAAATPSINFTGFTTAGFYYASGVGVSIGASSVGLFTATGLNACAIGATTPSTGVFTTLNAKTISTAVTASANAVQGSGGSFVTVLALPTGWGVVNVVAEENGTTNVGYYRVDFVNGTGVGVSANTPATAGATTGQLTFQLSGSNLQARGSNVTAPTTVKYWVESFAF